MPISRNTLREAATQGQAALSPAPANSKAPCCDPAVAGQLAAILETAADAIVIIDDRGTVQTFNRAAEQMFGYEREEVVGQSVNLLIPEPYRSSHDAAIAAYLKTGIAKIIGIGRETVAQRKNGTIFPIELAVSEVVADGRRTFTGVVRDISERRQLECELLEVAEREQQRFGYELHDGICQEIAGIAFTVQSLHQAVSAGGTIDAAECRNVTTLLQAAVHHARVLARGLYPVDPQPHGLSVALAQLAADTSDVFKVQCEFQSPRPVAMRPPNAATHLYRIAHEAVREALRRGRANRIVIALASKGHSMVMTVSDNGVGLEADGRYRHDLVLQMMQHRARVIGAKLQVLPGTRGTGVRVVCEMPFPD